MSSQSTSCRRFWLYGPPGARSCYLYFNPNAPKWRPMLRIHRFHWREMLIGSYRHHVLWGFAYPLDLAPYDKYSSYSAWVDARWWRRLMYGQR